MTVASAVPSKLTHARVLAVTLPIILANITTPLVGAVDIGVIGQLGDAALLGGVAVGAEIAQLLFWSFSFLKMGTGGLTAQAKGAGDTREIAANLERALLVAVTVGLMMIALQAPLGAAGLWLMGGSPEVTKAAHVYYTWRVWAAPFVFINYALLGWFIGLAETGRALAIQLLLNAVNIAASILLVLSWRWGIAGAGAAALIAEIAASVAGLLLANVEITKRGGRAERADVLAAGPLRRLLSVNRDIMIRTVCLMLAFATVAALGARNGDLALAANGILLNLFSIAANVVDGFANTAETFVGHAVGARRRDQMLEAVWMTSLWAGVIAALASVVMWLFGGLAIDAMTTSPAVREATRAFLPWCALTPVAGFAAFQLDGIYIGATRGRDMRNLMIVSLATFLAAAAVLVPFLGNHGVWAALLIFFAARGISYAYRFPALMRDVFGP